MKIVIFVMLCVLSCADLAGGWLKAGYLCNTDFDDQTSIIFVKELDAIEKDVDCSKHSDELSRPNGKEQM